MEVTGNVHTLRIFFKTGLAKPLKYRAFKRRSVLKPKLEIHATHYSTYLQSHVFVPTIIIIRI